MRRSYDDVSGSLELLLDTICNTFGGILFLAILVAVLLRMSHRLHQQSTEEPSESAETISQRAELAELLSQIETLRLAQAEQSSLADQFTSPEVSPLQHQIRQLQAVVSGQKIKRIRLQEEIASFQATLEAISGSTKQLAADADTTEHAISSAEQKLKQEVQRRTRATAVPRMHTTAKDEIRYILRYGRLYAHYNYDFNRSTRTLNTTDFAVLGEEGGYLRTTPKPYAGLKIEDSNEFRSAWRGRLAELDRRRHHICIIVWNDSFDHFATVKEELVNAGFEYRLLLSKSGATLREGYVPNPQVQ